MKRLLLLSFLMSCNLMGGGDKDEGKPADTADADTDTDTDADTDADTDTDTDTDTTPPDFSTFAGFVEAHANAYCASLRECTYLDDQGYASVSECETAITDLYNSITCTEYQPDVGAICVQQDTQMVDACTETHSGLEPLPCRDVCTPPRE